ncbi:elongation factor 1-beta [Candidatus Woesearchaeota archaeon]|nr:elongation factor 1-beta [Candidatus Woesearchaeota archaeon]
MADVLVTLKIMPDAPDTDLEHIKKDASQKISVYTGRSVLKSEIQPIAFGIKAVLLTFDMDEAKGSTDDLEADIRTIAGVHSAEVTDVRRAIG